MACLVAARARLLSVFLAIFCVLPAAATARAARVVISCGAVGKELELCREGARAWAARTGNQAEVVPAPNSSGDRLGQYQLFLAAGATDIDVFVIDTTWPGMLADFFEDLRGRVPEAAIQEHFPAFVANDTVKGRLIAIPWFIDAGVLYYRKDLLARYREPVPETWEQLTSEARRIQDAERAAGDSRLWGYVFQGRAYEGLTCNALEWIAGSGGGTLVAPDGRITVDNPAAVRALALAASWVGAISPEGVLNSMEEESRGAFQSGLAVFMRNWPYAWQLLNAPGSPVRGKVGLAPLPGGAAALGGWSLAVSKFSREKAAAASLALYLASPEEQKRRALAAGLNPTIPALYRDPELLRAEPELATLLRVFERAVARPSQATGPKYNRFSAEFWEAAHRALAGQESAPMSLADLKAALERISRGGRWK